MRRYDHALLELLTLSDLLEQQALDVEAIEQTLWILSRGQGKPGAQVIAGRLTVPLLHAYPHLASYLERVVDESAGAFSMKARRRLYRAIETIIGALPSDKRNKHIEVQDLAWRAVLLDKGRESVRAATLANSAIDLASHVGPPRGNAFMWWSRLGDAHFIAASASGDPNNQGWPQGRECYGTALKYAFADSKPMTYLRQALAVARQLALYETKPSPDALRGIFELADEGCGFANKASECLGGSEAAIFLRAQIEATLAAVARMAAFDGVDSLEERFFHSIEELLARQPVHSGAILLALRLLIEKGDGISAFTWSDRHVTSLRRNNSAPNQAVADYLEFRTAKYSLDLGLEYEARGRLIRIVTETQPKNSEAWQLLSQVGIRASPEKVAQDLYAEAQQQAPGSDERMELSREALQSNHPLIASDPGMTDAVRWTRQARLLLFQDSFSSAIEILKKLQSKFPSDPSVPTHEPPGFNPA